MEDTIINTECSGKACGWSRGRGAEDRGLGCDAGDGSCSSAFLLQSELSDSNPHEIRDVTEQINNLLNPLLRGPDGKTLSFLHTKFGTVVRYVKHGQPHAVNRVTWQSSNEDVAWALGLPYVRAEASQDSQIGDKTEAATAGQDAKGGKPPGK